MTEVDVAATRCGRCSAAVRSGAPWCTQCFAPQDGSPQRPDQPVHAVPPRAVVVTAAPPAVPEPVVAGADGPPGARTPPASAGWPCTSCETVSALTDDACTGCGRAFLAEVRGGDPTLVLPAVGDLTALSPGRRTALALALVVAFLVLCTALGLLLG